MVQKLCGINHQGSGCRAPKGCKEKIKSWSPWKLLYHWQLLWHWPRRGVRAKCDGPTPFIAGHLRVTFNSRRHVLPADARVWKHTEATNAIWASSLHAGIWKGGSLTRSNSMIFSQYDLDVAFCGHHFFITKWNWYEPSSSPMPTTRPWKPLQKRQIAASSLPTESIHSYYQLYRIICHSLSESNLLAGCNSSFVSVKPK